MGSYPQIRSFGDTGFSVEFGEGIDRQVNAMVMALHAALADADLPGVVETIPSFRALLVAYDPLVASRAGLEAQVRAMLPDLKAQSRAGRLWRLPVRSEEHTSELQSLMRISYAVFCLKKKNTQYNSTRSVSTIESHKHRLKINTPDH